MSRIFFARTDAERKRQKRTAEREKTFVAAVEDVNDDDNTVNDEIDISDSNPILINDQPPLFDTQVIDNTISQQPNTAVSIPSSNEEDDDDDDFEELVRANDVNYQRKIYNGSFLSVRDACETIIKLSRRLNLDKSKTNILLQGIRSLLPNDNKLPRTIVGLMRILGRQF
jgi:hypothetical protein